MPDVVVVVVAPEFGKALEDLLPAVVLWREGDPDCGEEPADELPTPIAPVSAEGCLGISVTKGNDPMVFLGEISNTLGVVDETIPIPDEVIWRCIFSGA